MMEDSISSLLQTYWYPIFLPTCKVKSFKVCWWKVIVINSGQDPEKPLLCKNHKGKTRNLSRKTLTTRFIPETTYIAMALHYGYELVNKDIGEMEFKPSISRA